VLCGFADIAFFVVAVPDEGLTTVFRGVTDRGLPTVAIELGLNAAIGLS